MNRPSMLLSAVQIQDLWESRASRILGRVGLRGVRTTILTLAVVATLIPSVATSWISYRQNRLAIENSLNEQLAASSTQAAREVGLWLKERIYDLRVFSASYEVTENVERGTATRRLPDYLSSVNERFPDFRGLVVVAPDERVVASAGETPQRLQFAGDWMRNARQGDPLLGEPTRAGGDAGTDGEGTTPATVTMEVAVPITNATGRFLGVFAARLDFAGIEARIRDIVASPEHRLFLVRRDGMAMVSIGGALAAVPAAALRDLEDAEGATVAYLGVDGTPVLGVVAEVPNTEWLTVAELPTATAFADIRQLRNATVLLVLVLLAIVGSLAYALGLIIVIPLERLSRAANRVAGGDLDVDVPVTGAGEISQLTGVFNDMVRRLREGRAELERLSVTDELTGLANRRLLAAELEREVKRSERHGHPFAVLMLDVDHFKTFNDTHGHQAGDGVLQHLARMLRETARAADTVARYGGEEFTIILPETPAAESEKIAKRILKSVAGLKIPVDDATGEVSITVSIGYAGFPTHGSTGDALIAAADQALYRSKEAGRNRLTKAG